MFARMSILIVGLAALAVIGGCGDENKAVNNDPGPDDQDSPSLVPAELVAVWTFQSASIEGSAVPLHQLFSWEAGSVGCRITIFGDETYVYQEVGRDDAVVWVEAGGFAVESDTFTMTTDHPMLKSGVWAVDGTRLTLTVTTQAGYELVIEATK